MKRMVLQSLLVLSGLLMLFRFGAPALIFGATGPGPFGNRWMAEGTTATLLLDADLRFFGAMMLGIGAIFFWMIPRVEVLGSVVYILAAAVALGAAEAEWLQRIAQFLAGADIHVAYRRLRLHFSPVVIVRGAWIDSRAIAFVLVAFGVLRRR